MPASDKPLYITYEWLWRNGRLGNQLWQIASTAGVAAANVDAVPRFPKWEYQPYFNVPEEFFVDALPAERLDLGTDYLQDLRHIRHIEDQVRDWFEPSDQVEGEIARRHPWFFDFGHFTAVHIRRGDYVGLPNHFPAPTLGYYSTAAKLILEEVPDTTFVVFSDDPDWCEENLKSATFHDAPFRVIHGTPRPVEMVDRKGEPEDQYDLFLMTLCDKHIISNSTFSWWGAFLSWNKQVIYPSVWFGPALNWQPCPAPDTWIRLDSTC